LKVKVMALTLVALLCGCTAGTTGQGPVGTPPATTAGCATVLTTDINLYSPLMSSAFGIHIFATDGNGNPVKGKWTATWGQFCTAKQENGDGWKIGEGKAEWDGASDIWWQFSTTPNPNGEMPSAVSVYFNGGGAGQTLLLEKAGPMTVKVSGSDAAVTAPPPTPTAAAN
jgi:hypothetical protein